MRPMGDCHDRCQAKLHDGELLLTSYNEKRDVFVTGLQQAYLADITQVMLEEIRPT